LAPNAGACGWPLNETELEGRRIVLLVVIATYNEIESLPALIDEIKLEIPNASILVIDDNSPDGTGKWCENQRGTRTDLRCIVRTGKLGLGSATILGLQTAVEEGFEFVATLDADGSHDPRDLAAMWNEIQLAKNRKVGLILGSRYIRGGRIEGWPITRRVASRLVNLFVRWLLWIPVRDTTGAFRIYRTDDLKRVDPMRIRSAGYAYLEEILFRLHQAGVKIVEWPITFRDRQGGASKANWREAVGILYRVLCLALRI
jgi:dolichol-phosphate mannosyltransferase